MSDRVALFGLSCSHMQARRRFWGECQKNMARSFRTGNARSLLLTAAAVAFVSGSFGGRAEAAASGPFLAHQALYELSLVKSRGSNSINSARGRILCNSSGSACEGYTSEFRQVSELDS